MAQPKTNAMRMLDKAKVNYTFHEYDHSDGAIDGVAVAAKLGQDPARVFKTLVTQGASRAFYVFVIPVAEELDLKAAAGRWGRRAWPCSTWRTCSRPPAMCGAGAAPWA